MPRTRIRPRHHRQFAVDRAIVRYLLTGVDFFGDVVSRGEPYLRTVWASLRCDLLRQWTQALAGSRPFAWWLWDSPEPRRQTGGPSCADRDHHWHGTPSPRPAGATFESQADYLLRLNLLGPDEANGMGGVYQTDVHQGNAMNKILNQFPEESTE